MVLTCRPAATIAAPQASQPRGAHRWVIRLSRTAVSGAALNSPRSGIGLSSAGMGYGISRSSALPAALANHLIIGSLAKVIVLTYRGLAGIRYLVM
jgi:hypothetical protein